jgi:uncharacterized membrane protein
MRSSGESLFLVALLAIAAVIGCGSDETSDEAPDETPDAGQVEQTVACPEDSPLTYDSFGDPFMRNWCTACHSSDLPAGTRQGAPVAVDLDSRAGVLEWTARIEARALGEPPTMPPTPGPSADERTLLAEWLACGAP